MLHPTSAAMGPDKFREQVENLAGGGGSRGGSRGGS
jgi:hypothetical protein